MAVVRCRRGDERHQDVLELAVGVPFHVFQQGLQQQDVMQIKSMQIHKGHARLNTHTPPVYIHFPLTTEAVIPSISSFIRSWLFFFCKKAVNTLYFDHEQQGAATHSASGFLISLTDELPLSTASVGENVNHHLLFGAWGQTRWVDKHEDQAPVSL